MELTEAPATPMRKDWISAVPIAVLIAVLDGFDVQAMAFAAPAVLKAWQIDKAALGLALGSSLFGMAGGSLLLAPLGDLWGRRQAILIGLLVMILGTLATAYSLTMWHLVASRVLTGIGVGAMIPLTTAIAAEYAGERHLNMAVAATAVGHAVGGAGGGLISGLLLSRYDWRAIFLFGAGAGVVLLIAAMIGLPRTAPSRVVAPRDRQTHRGSYRLLFGRELRATTIRFTAIYVLLVIAAYYLLSWLPQLVADGGHPPAMASRITGLAGLVGIASGLGAGALARRVGPTLLASIAMIGFGAALVGIGLVPRDLTSLIIAAGTCTLFLSAATAVLYATLATSFPAEARVSGIGFVMGVGRLMSGFSPYLAGVLFATGLSRGAVSASFAAAAMLAGLLLVSAWAIRGPIEGVGR